jgi:hypothetical protein
VSNLDDLKLVNSSDVNFFGPKQLKFSLLVIHSRAVNSWTHLGASICNFKINAANVNGTHVSDEYGDQENSKIQCQLVKNLNCEYIDFITLLVID